jgi:hypothetical protein
MSQPDAHGPSATIASSAAPEPPWNAAAAYAYTDGAEIARRLETSLLNQTAGPRPRPRRGGSDANTRAALEAIVRLSVALSPADAGRVTRILLRTAAETQALPAVDEVTRWVQIRATPGQRPPVCPYCGTFSLRLAENGFVVMCFGWQPSTTGEDGQRVRRPCTDREGRRPVARLELSRINGDPVLVFADGLVIGAAPE